MRAGFRRSHRNTQLTPDHKFLMRAIGAHPPSAKMLQGRRLIADPAEVRDFLHVPRVWPAITEFFVGADGTYWLRQAQPPAPNARFWRITHDGKPLPPVSIPAGLTIHRVTANRLWAVREDDDGVPVIEMREVVASPAR